jgi:hypothetical protein
MDYIMWMAFREYGCILLCDKNSVKSIEISVRNG